MVKPDDVLGAVSQHHAVLGAVLGAVARPHAVLGALGPELEAQEVKVRLGVCPGVLLRDPGLVFAPKTILS